MSDIPSSDNTQSTFLSLSHYFTNISILHQVSASGIVPVYDLQHHVATKPLERQYAELVAIHFGSFALSRGPLMSRKTAKKFVKYIWSITLGLLPYDGPVQQPPITADDITYVALFLIIALQHIIYASFVLSRPFPTPTRSSNAVKPSQGFSPSPSLMR